MTHTILDGTTTTGPVFRFERWGVASILVTGASAAAAVQLDARPAGVPGAAWVPVEGATFDADRMRTWCVDSGLEYRARAVSAGPTVRITTTLGVTT